MSFRSQISFCKGIRTFATRTIHTNRKKPEHPSGGERPNLPTQKQDESRVRISKTMSWLLRHAAEREGLPVRSDGYVRVRDLLRATELNGLDFLGLEKIVQMDRKQRFTLSYEPHGSAAGPSSQPHMDSWWIRANQGHSMTAVSNLELRRITSSDEIPMAVHGTSVEAWKTICEDEALNCLSRRALMGLPPATQGLSRKARNHIHLAQGVAANGVISGMRKGSRILIYIDLDKAMANGIKFYVSTNGVLLTEGEHGILHPKYFQRVEALKKTYRPIPGWDGAVTAGEQVKNFVEDTQEDTLRDATHTIEALEPPSFDTVEPRPQGGRSVPKVQDEVTLL
ncbi:tRNA 2'-phosphotransferase [Marasmius sp. AFHP31]|nr:tRNA 2'-phosphotransferase [Marasmius sp. AFHP31]